MKHMKLAKVFLFIIILTISTGCEIRLVQEINDNTSKDPIIENSDNSNDNLSEYKTADDKSNKSDKSESTNASVGRLEISNLNIKADITESQILFTQNGLNNIGNTVLLLEDLPLSNLELNDEIYIRNSSQEKMIYTVSNIYNTSKNDTNFYNQESNQTILTIITYVDDSNILVIQAKNN